MKPIILNSKDVIEKWTTLRLSAGYDSDLLFANHLLCQEEDLQNSSQLSSIVEVQFDTTDAEYNIPDDFSELQFPSLTVIKQEPGTVTFGRPHKKERAQKKKPVDSVTITPLSSKKVKPKPAYDSDFDYDLDDPDDLDFNPNKKKQQKPKTGSGLAGKATEKAMVITFGKVDSTAGRKGGGALKSKDNDLLSKNSFRIYKCPFCQQLFASQLSLNEHSDNGCNHPLADQLVDKVALVKRMQIDKKNRVCWICNKTMKTRHSLKAHVRIIHCDNPKKERRFECDQCPKVFLKKHSLQLHYKSHTGEMELCTVCGKSFMEKRKLESHMESHFGQKSFQCPKCDRAYYTQRLLNVHVRVVHTKDRIPCDICGRTFNTRHQLEFHRNTHNDDRPFKCEECGKGFNHPSSLTGHRLLHTGEGKPKKHACQQCGKAFIKLHMLKHHMNIHTGDKPYPCTLCDKRFHRPGLLKTHMNVHLGIRPYRCKLCGKDYPRGQHLKQHMKTSHGLEGVKCEKEPEFRASSLNKRAAQPAQVVSDSPAVVLDKRREDFEAAFRLGFSGLFSVHNI